MVAPTTTANPATGRQPRALYVLFFTELWERFSFYGVQPLLVLYLAGPFHFGNARATAVTGWFTGLVYVTPIFGGLLADRVVGYRAAVLGGAILMTAGDFLLGVRRLPVVYLAIALVVLGNGGFKANISTIVGKLYGPDDDRRDRGFTIFYMGINLGAIAAPLVCGYLGENVGWAWGFAAAGFGLAISCVIFTLGGRALADLDLRPMRGARSGAAHAPLGRVEARRLAMLGVVLLFVVVFWVGYAQSWLTLLLWAKDNTYRPLLPGWLGGKQIPATWSQSIEPIWVVALATPMSMLWAFLGRRRREPSSPAKMALGLVVLGLAFVVMLGAAVVTGGHGASMAWLVLFFFIVAVGELALSPVGLSLVTQLAPARFAGALMGVWFITSAIGFKLGGTLAGLWGRTSHAVFFGLCAGLSLITGLVLTAVLPALRRITEEIA